MTIEYEQDYIRAWDALLDDLQFVSFQTVQQANDALRILTAPTSPLRGLLRVVADNTTLVENAPAAAAPKGVIAETRQKVSDSVAGILKPVQDAPGMPSGEPGRMVTAHFQWVRQLTAGEAGKTQLDAIIQIAHADPAAARHAGPRCGRRESRADPVEPVVPRS